MQIITKEIPIKIRLESCSEDLINEASDLILDDENTGAERLQGLKELLEENEKALEIDLVFPLLDENEEKAQGLVDLLERVEKNTGSQLIFPPSDGCCRDRKNVAEDEN